MGCIFVFYEQASIRELTVRKPTWKAKQIAMVLAALVLGMLVSLQWTAGAARSPAASDQVIRTIRQLELEQGELKRQVGRLREELDAIQRDAVADTEMLEELRAELALQKAHAGLLAVQGPGIRVILDDSKLVLGGNASESLIHDFDLRDVINVLWLAGAEAVAVNDERVVNSTSVYCVGTTVMVNDTRLSPPYEISAIGDPVRLQDYLRNTGYLSELKARSKRIGLRMEFIRADTMTLSAYRGSLPQRFVQPGS
jgi:uncharacterized protein YlxW (UPF0749 family)